MKKVKLLLATVNFGMLLMVSSCQEEAFTAEELVATSAINGKTTKEDNGGWNPPKRREDYPDPEITFEVFSPEDLYDMRTLVWRIEWPAYEPGSDANKIPTVFNPDGSLRSIDFLNSTSPLNTLKSVFSLYHEGKIKKAQDMDDVLSAAVNPPPGSMESVVFKYSFEDPATIEEVRNSAENSPGYMVHHFLYADEELTEFIYEAGDVLFFKLSGPNYPRYGAIYVESMSPRIIEVFMSASSHFQPGDFVVE